MAADDRPVSTGEAAKVIGVHRGTLTRWWQQGLVQPRFVTPTGYARWDLDDLRAQLQEWRLTDDEGPPPK